MRSIFGYGFPMRSLCIGFSMAPLLVAPAKALNIQLVVDNDFALFSGTSTSVNTLLYQNNNTWPQQLVPQSNPIANAPPRAIIIITFLPWEAESWRKPSEP